MLRSKHCRYLGGEYSAQGKWLLDWVDWMNLENKKATVDGDEWAKVRVGENELGVEIVLILFKRCES